MEKIRSGDSLLIVDVQNDFCPDGALAVPEGDAVVPLINRIAGRFPVVVPTQDWHPPGHISFASRHPGKNPYEVIRIGDFEQVLWPDHCVRGTQGADFHPDLDTTAFHHVLRKGTGSHMDSYSAFLENDKKTRTGLAGLLRELEVKRVFVAGLATDYCVLYSSRDAVAAGFEVVVLEDACRGVDVPPGNLQAALKEMREKGVRIMNTHQLSE